MRRKQHDAVDRALFSFFEDADAYELDVRDSSNADRDPVDWVTGYRWIHGAQWSYDTPGPKIEYGEFDLVTDILRRPYLPQYMRDRSPQKSVIKCRQSEFSEALINESLFYCCTRPFTGVTHVFPTDALGDAISITKIEPAVTQSPRIYEKLRRAAVRRYLFRNGSIYGVTGALKRSGGRAQSVDIVNYDERDLLPESITGVYNEMMSHSSLRLERSVSTPTAPDVGIDKLVKEGALWEWHWVCIKCKKEQQFKFPDSLINFFDISGAIEEGDEVYLKRMKKVFIGCRYCGAYCDRNSDHYVQHARWVAERPGQIGLHGSYRVSSFMIPWKTGFELIRMYHKLALYLGTYFNEVIGIAYVKGGMQLTESEIINVQADWLQVPVGAKNMNNTSIGFDWGEKESWAVVVCDSYDNRNPNKLCVVATICINDALLAANGLSDHPSAHAEMGKKLAHLYNAMVIVNDANGIGVDRNKYLVSAFPAEGRVFGAFFDTAEVGRQLRQTKLLIPKWQKTLRKVTFSKVNGVKEIFNMFRQKMIAIPAEAGEGAENVRIFRRHMRGLTIQPRWSIEQDREYEQVTKLGPDHFFDALMYATKGYEWLVGLGGHRRDPGFVAKRSSFY